MSVRIGTGLILLNLRGATVDRRAVLANMVSRERLKRWGGWKQQERQGDVRKLTVLVD